MAFDNSNNIKELYNLIEDKKGFISLIAKDFDREPRSVANHWFSGYFSVPKDKSNEVVSYMQNYISNQNGAPINCLKNE